ncbi:S-adenosylmethionine mitochondrial carrier protein homolog [Homalodisca vitripennis]|uniref:S-adenosylmethionine mitochondrial carrier protein homolog n=1 Tax=Homalodisca vitripennis TaxID=197043 RepID=UPI001EE9D35F|nr:S-adenosylmethionine mitochondrial carrier protein homolog [Homalodisca vitripennis]
MESENIPSAITSFTAGAVAGLTVDVALFPLDTLKTRIQSEKGFWKSGGFKQIYKGIGPTAAGSAPCAAIFFLTYNETKGFLQPYIGGNWSPVCHIISASVAEVTVNVVKVPIEIVKQRRQTTKGVSTLAIVRKAIHNEGLRGMYRGFVSTVMRDVPFSVIQFPLWEALKSHIQMMTGEEVTPAQSAFSGAAAGAVAGAATTPLDLAKTRIMLAEHRPHCPSETRMLPVLREIYRLKGLQGVFAGFVPRTVFIFLGGGVFFGCYDFARGVVESMPFFKHKSKES